MHVISTDSAIRALQAGHKLDFSLLPSLADRVVLAAYRGNRPIAVGPDAQRQAKNPGVTLRRVTLSELAKGPKLRPFARYDRSLRPSWPQANRLNA